MKHFNSHKVDNGMEKEWQPLGRLPNWTRENINYKRISKCNRYLMYQEKRLKDAYAKKQYEKVVLIWFLLLKNSKSYQIMLFNRVKRDWYWSMTQQEARNLLLRMMNKCRRWDWQLMLDRFYILKKDGKWRPIGSPTFESRLMSKSLTDLITFLFEDSRGVHQHGYRHNKGVHTSLQAVIEKLKKGYKEVFEFDLKCFFNNVRWHWINLKISEKSELLTDLVYGMLVRIHYTFKELRPEEELKPIKDLIYYKGQWRAGLVRKGLPQGLSVSPLLATLAMEKVNIPDDVVMYADDGVFIGDNWDEDFVRWIEHIEDMGVQMAFEKSGFVTEELKFLGTIINLKNETISYKESTISWHDPKLTEWTRKVAQFYGKKTEGWTWNIETDSYLWNNISKLSWWLTIKIMIVSIWEGGSYQGYRYFLGKGVFDVTGGSSKCMDGLLFNVNMLSPLRVLPLLVPKTRNYRYPLQKKNIYLEKLHDELTQNIFTKRSVYESRDEF